MCKAAPCETCGKTTWRGCGRHAEEIMAATPEPERCTCPRPPADQPQQPAPPRMSLPVV